MKEQENLVNVFFFSGVEYTESEKYIDIIYIYKHIAHTYYRLDIAIYYFSVRVFIL